MLHEVRHAYAKKKKKKIKFEFNWESIFLDLEALVRAAPISQVPVGL